MEIIAGTGEMPILSQIENATGATRRRVDTFSVNADMKPANRASTKIAIFTFGALSITISPKREGIRDSIRSATIPIVPKRIPNTFQFIISATDVNGTMLEATKIIAPIIAIWCLFFGNRIRSK